MVRAWRMIFLCALQHQSHPVEAIRANPATTPHAEDMRNVVCMLVTMVIVLDKVKTQARKA